MPHPSQPPHSTATAEPAGPALAESTLGLLGRAQAGDDRAREVLWGRLLPQLRRWAHGRLPRGARSVLDTDDIVQETFSASLQAADRFDPQHSGALYAYFRKTVISKVCDAGRRAARQPAADGSVGGLADPRPSPIEEAVGKEVLERYEIALRSLKQEDRDVVCARLELDLSFQEIAEALGKVSADAARMSYNRAIARLVRKWPRDPT